jgi:hypothetical protein
MKTMLLNATVDLENELKALRKRIKSKSPEQDMGSEDLDRLKYVQEELIAILT